MKNYNIAILGATGLVGLEIIKILNERNFPVNNLYLFASKKSAGKEINIDNKKYIVNELTEEIFDNFKIDIVFSAISNELSKKFLPIAAKKNIFVIDNSSAFRLDKNVPLIIPEINPEDLDKHQNIIANPNCATIIGLMALYGLNKFATINSIIVSTYQAVSGAGINGITELENQISNKNMEIKQFSKQIAYNIIPQIGEFNNEGYSSEEIKFQNEGRKILHNDKLLVNCTCVRIPVIRSHSESITVYFDKEISIEKAKEILQFQKGIKFIDLPDFPTPIDVSNKDTVFVGRLRKNTLSNDNKSLTLWCVGDQIRKGAASNAVDIAQLYIKKMTIN